MRFIPILFFCYLSRPLYFPLSVCCVGNTEIGCEGFADGFIAGDVKERRSSLQETFLTSPNLPQRYISAQSGYGKDMRRMRL